MAARSVKTTPAAQTPAAQKPAAKKPAAKKPAAKKPVTKQGVAKQGVAKQGVAKQPVSNKASAKKPAAQKPVANAATASSPRRAGEVRYWLMKTEPEVFSFDDMLAAADRTTCWDGVRNYQARNMLRDEMKLGDLVVVYHSNAEPPGAIGLSKVVREGYVDHTQFDSDDHHFDPGADRANPRWFMVDVQAVEKFPRLVGLPELREVPELSGMALLQKGSRLSVQPVKPFEFATLCKLAGL
jgi:predicted RNA-binding protein with PUA-like domain